MFITSYSDTIVIFGFIKYTMFAMSSAKRKQAEKSEKFAYFLIVVDEVFYCHIFKAYYLRVT